MISDLDVWSKYRKWYTAENVFHESEDTLLKEILNTMDVEKTDGAEIYQKMETHGKMIKIKLLYMLKILSPLLKFMVRW